MNQKRSLWLAAIAVSVVMMALIVCFSSQSGKESNDLSKGLAGELLKLLQIIRPEITMDCLNLVLRKLAHFSLYFVLGCSLTGVFCKQGRVTSVLLAILVGAVFAASDELHQYFSDGRNANVKDVLLDTCGVAVGSISSRKIMNLLKRLLKLANRLNICSCDD